jgi:predicted glycoside hydrolase/deacetylase ChbG (UPF0249 family)
MEKRLIINADDFGLCESVNLAVAKANADGVLTSATIMANMPSAEQAVSLAKGLKTLGVGVHLNIDPDFILTNDKIFVEIIKKLGQKGKKPASLGINSLFSKMLRLAIESEFTAQIQFLLDRGLKPTHLDSHKHIHCSPAIYPIVCRLAEKFNLPAVRWPLESPEVYNSQWPAIENKDKNRSRILRMMAKINRLQCKKFIKTDAIFGVAHTGRIDLDFYKALSRYNNFQTAELMTHPGYAKGLEKLNTRLIAQREIELEAMCSCETKMLLENAGIKLIHYGQL